MPEVSSVFYNRTEESLLLGRRRRKRKDDIKADDRPINLRRNIRRHAREAGFLYAGR